MRRAREAGREARGLITWVWCCLGDARRRARSSERAQTAFTAEYDGHALVTLPVTQDARAHIAHGAQRALVARDPLTVTPVKTRLRIE
jgi:hypothetical protein